MVKRVYASAIGVCPTPTDERVDMEAYDVLVKDAKSASNTGDTAQFKLARLTHEAVMLLTNPTDGSKKLSKNKAYERWAADLVTGARKTNFSPSSARRYFTLWEKYGPEESRLVVGEGEEAQTLNFAEHYYVVSQGLPTLTDVSEAKSAGTSTRTAATRTRRGPGAPASTKDNGGRPAPAPAPEVVQPSAEETEARLAEDERIVATALMASAIRDDKKIKPEKKAEAWAAKANYPETQYDAFLTVAERAGSGFEGNRPSEVLAELTGDLRTAPKVRDRATLMPLLDTLRIMRQRVLDWADQGEGFSEEEYALLAAERDAASVYVAALADRLPEPVGASPGGNHSAA